MVSTKKVGERIFALRKERSWTLADLSERCGVSPGQLSKIENGADTSTRTLRKVESALSLEANELDMPAATRLDLVARVLELHREIARAEREESAEAKEARAVWRALGGPDRPSLDLALGSVG